MTPLPSSVGGRQARDVRMKRASAPWRRSVAIPAVLACVLLLTVHATEAQAPSPSPSPAPDYLARARQLLEGYDRDRVIAQIRELYEQAKASGERVPADLWAWVREDLARVGAWEYRVVRMQGAEPPQLEAELNTLGRERWECVAISPGKEPKDLVLVFKRPMKTYLGQLNVRDVLRVLPGS
jgi:hypothetical protein